MQAPIPSRLPPPKGWHRFPGQGLVLDIRAGRVSRWCYATSASDNSGILAVPAALSCRSGIPVIAAAYSRRGRLQILSAARTWGVARRSATCSAAHFGGRSQKQPHALGAVAAARHGDGLRGCPSCPRLHLPRPGRHHRLARPGGKWEDALRSSWPRGGVAPGSTEFLELWPRLDSVLNPEGVRAACGVRA